MQYKVLHVHLIRALFLIIKIAHFVQSGKSDQNICIFSLNYIHLQITQIHLVTTLKLLSRKVFGNHKCSSTAVASQSVYVNSKPTPPRQS